MCYESCLFYLESESKDVIKCFSQTEIWSLDDGAFNIKLAEPFLSGFYDYPELFLVDTQFCMNK